MTTPPASPTSSSARRLGFACPRRHFHLPTDRHRRATANRSSETGRSSRRRGARASSPESRSGESICLRLLAMALLTDLVGRADDAARSAVLLVLLRVHAHPSTQL